MPRPSTKEDLLKASQENYTTLMDFIDSMTEKELNTPFDFSGQPSKKEAQAHAAVPKEQRKGNGEQKSNINSASRLQLENLRRNEQYVLEKPSGNKPRNRKKTVQKKPCRRHETHRKLHQRRTIQGQIFLLDRHSPSRFLLRKQHLQSLRLGIKETQGPQKELQE